jgi:hypothetical protein
MSRCKIQRVESAVSGGRARHRIKIKAPSPESVRGEAGVEPTLVEESVSRSR